MLTEVPKRVFPKFSEPRLYERIPPIILTSEEMRSIRITQDPGLFTKALQSFICIAQHSLSFMSLWNPAPCLVQACRALPIRHAWTPVDSLYRKVSEPFPGVQQLSRAKLYAD